MQFDTTNAVGDVTSTARGSGARFNNGKPDLSLIPLCIVAASFGPVGDMGHVNWRIRDALWHLGKFQTTGLLVELNCAIALLTPFWRDCAQVFDYGRKKYAEWNWAKGMAWSIPLACGGRHALAALEGEENDAESGLSHVGHFLCNLVMLRTFITGYPEGNDLPDPSYFA
jgi:hypothetical protein